MRLQGGIVTPTGSLFPLTVAVAGTPAPQGSKKIVRRHGKAFLVDDNDGAKQAWRTAVVAACTRSYGRVLPYDGPVAVTLSFRLPMPKTRRAAVRRVGVDAHTVKPDLDKLVRNTLDGLTDAGVIVDDSRVWQIHASKTEHDAAVASPGVTITVAAYGYWDGP